MLCNSSDEAVCHQLTILHRRIVSAKRRKTPETALLKQKQNTNDHSKLIFFAYKKAVENSRNKNNDTQKGREKGKKSKDCDTIDYGAS